MSQRRPAPLVPLPLLLLLFLALPALLALGGAALAQDSPEPTTPADAPDADAPDADAPDADAPDDPQLGEPSEAEAFAPTEPPTQAEYLRSLEQRLGRLEAERADERAAERAASEGALPAWVDAALGRLEVHGVGVASYVFNTRRPDQRKNGNRYRVSDLDHDTFSPTFFKLGLQRSLTGENTWDAGFRFEVAAGTYVEDTLSLDPNFLGGEEINLANAYVEVQVPTPLNPLSVRFGRAYGWFGLDSVDLYDQPLFSMSWFGNYTPFTNTGLFLEMELVEGLTLMQYVGNGSEFVVDNNDAKTLGGRLLFEGIERLSLAFNWIWGPERDDNVHDGRWQLELDVVWEPLDATALYLMLHVGQEEGQAIGGGTAKFGGASLAVRQGLLEVSEAAALTDFLGRDPDEAETFQRVSLLGRVSVYRDQGGVNSGLDQTLSEFAGGVEVKPTSFSWVRVEYRHDLSSQSNAFRGRRGQATRRSMGTLALAIGIGF